MKLSSLAFLATLGMTASAAAAYLATPPGGAPGAVARDGAASSTPTSTAGASAAEPTPAALHRFTGGATLAVEARLANANAPRAQSSETYVLLEVKGSADAAATSQPVHLSVVIDRSGSMRGQRIENAIQAASTAVDRLSDGDVVSLVTFDTQAKLEVAPTVLDPRSRSEVKRAISEVRLGGDTCISCGMVMAQGLAAQTPGKAQRMLVLSDGDTNSGIRDEAGLRALARDTSGRGMTVTSIGVDLRYNERLMAAIAEGGEGRHHFVGRPGDLAKVFEAEADGLRSTVAEGASARITLGAGVELLEVLDRTFTREGSSVVVPLGSFSRGEVKTVLARVRVPAARTPELSVAEVAIDYRDLTQDKPGRVEGKLAQVGADSADAPDPFVAARVERSRTADALEEANKLFRKGDIAGARAKVAARKTSVVSFSDGTIAAPKDPFQDRNDDALSDTRRQFESLSLAEEGFATPPPATTPQAPSPGRLIQPSNPFDAGESAVKQNQAAATDSRR